MWRAQALVLRCQVESSKTCARLSETFTPLLRESIRIEAAHNIENVASRMVVRMLVAQHRYERYKGCYHGVQMEVLEAGVPVESLVTFILHRCAQNDLLVYARDSGDSCLMERKTSLEWVRALSSETSENEI